MSFFKSNPVAAVTYSLLASWLPPVDPDEERLMPRYYFDVFDGSAAMIDPRGDNFVDVPEAADQAAALLADFARDALPHRRARDFAVAVRDDGGRDVYHAALVFRDDRLDPNRPASARDLHSPMTVPNPVELIRESREIRSEARALSDQVKAVRADVRESVHRLMETMSLAGAVPSAGR